MKKNILFRQLLFNISSQWLFLSSADNIVQNNTDQHQQLPYTANFSAIELKTADMGLKVNKGKSPQVDKQALAAYQISDYGRLLYFRRCKQVCLNEQRIIIANRYYYDLNSQLNGRDHSRGTKLLLHMSFILPVLFYDAEAWMLALFESKILRQIYTYGLLNLVK